MSFGGGGVDCRPFLAAYVDDMFSFIKCVRRLIRRLFLFLFQYPGLDLGFFSQLIRTHDHLILHSRDIGKHASSLLSASDTS